MSATKLIVLAGVALTVLQIKPPSDSGFVTDWHFYFNCPALVRTIDPV